MGFSRRALMANAVALTAMVAGCASSETPAPSSTNTDALGDHDATGVAARIRSGEITAAEALEAAIARSERVNGQLNFIATPMLDYGRARAAARLSGPFAGVPTLIKDLMPMVGQPTTASSARSASSSETRCSTTLALQATSRQVPTWRAWWSSAPGSSRSAPSGARHVGQIREVWSATPPHRAQIMFGEHTRGRRRRARPHVGILGCGRDRHKRFVGLHCRVPTHSAVAGARTKSGPVARVRRPPPVTPGQERARSASLPCHG